MAMEESPQPSPRRMHLLADAPLLAMGICVVAIGVALMLDRLGIVPAAQILRLWPVGIILIGAGMVAQALWPAPDGYTTRRRHGGFVPFFFLSIMLSSMLSFGLLGSQRAERRAGGGATADSNVKLFALWGRDKQVSASLQFKGGEMTSLWGATDLDLRQAIIAPGEEAVIDVFAVMGGAVLRVPNDWVVDMQTAPIMGGVEERRNVNLAAVPEGGTARPRLVVRGLVVMGGLTIRSDDK